jgi:hypothetical protein
MKRLVAVISLSIIAAISIAAQENTDLVRYYDSEIIKISKPAYGGLIVSAKGITSSTYFTLNPIISTMLNSYPESKMELEKYNSKAKVGSILEYGGWGLCLGSMGYIVGKSVMTTTVTNTDLLVFLSVITGGALTSVIGSEVFEQGFENLYNSVNVFNREKISEYNPGK